MFLFLLQTVLISLTGVIAPGPITAVTVGTGSRSPHSGALIAVGHGVVEFPLMALIYYGLGDILKTGQVRMVIFALGGAFLIFMGIDMLKNIATAGIFDDKGSNRPFAAGIILSLGNVYFLLWWATVGASLITKAVTFGIAGVMLFATVHWSCDFAWLYFLSVASYRGGRVFGIVFRKVVFAVCGSFLVFFGGMFLYDAIRIWIG